MMFIVFNSAFNTIIPQQLIDKLNLLGFSSSLCNWILDLLTSSQFGSAARLHPPTSILHLGSKRNVISSHYVLHTIYGYDDNNYLLDLT